MTKRKDAKEPTQSEPLIVDELGIPLAKPPKPDVISEEEQWRLINDTGILQRAQEVPEEDALANSLRERRCYPVGNIDDLLQDM
ncbi:hypothetical protein FRC09_019733 [Ceratobasidium sp. 395]|nr:hypothetical protein FRC09_019733 [Ceratobasidium sp. 395]